MMNKFGILTMSRGDEDRIGEWLKYHSSIGFDEFFIILDNPNDNSLEVINSTSVNAKIHIVVKPPKGPYYDGLDASTMWKKRKAWKEENRLEIESSGLPINDEISWRQYGYFTEAIQEIQDRGEISWLSLIDVDEYIVLNEYENVAHLVESCASDRIRLLNFNYDTSAYEKGGLSITSCSVNRWDYEDMVEFGRGWDKRCKSIVRVDKALPLASVHAISRGPFKMVSYKSAKLNHYKYPAANIIPYRVFDPLIW